MSILVKNGRVFDGRKPELLEHASIIIEGNLVSEITQETVAEDRFDRVIDVGNRVILPGLVDSHAHLASSHKDERWDETIVHGVNHARRMLFNGVTTIRDAGGNVYGLKKGIDEGWIPGPRIYPSHAYISQTCGHGDTRESRAHVRLGDGQYTSPNLRSGASVIADGPWEVTRAVREQLFLGASQIKIMAGGGMSSQYDPILTVQFTLEEMKAAVDAAADYGTYVMAHLYTREAMIRAARAGIRSFEHANQIDDELARIIRDQGIFICACPQPAADEEFRKRHNLPVRKGKPGAAPIRAAVETQTELINKYGLNLVFGTDYVEFIAKEIPNAQIRDFEYYERRFGTFKGLYSATGAANELIKLTTYQNPYPDGKIGVLEKGSYADLLAVEGNPLEDLKLLTDNSNLKLIMKDATVYKDELV